MRNSRIGKILACTILLVSVIASIVPASADIMVPTNTRVYFEKDGVPFNGSIDYTVNCYGHFDYPWIRETTPTQVNPAGEKEIIFSYSASCPGYGCTIYEPFYLNYRAIDTCDMQGTAGSIPFVLRNFTSDPYPKNCTDLRQFDMSKGDEGYFRATPEYRECENESLRASELCVQYVVPCTAGTDADCGKWIINGLPVKDTEKSRSCRDEADKKERACEAYLEKVDPSAMVLWRNNWTGRYEPAMRSCELHMTLPADTPENPALPVTPAVSDQTPVLTFGTPVVATAGSPGPLQSLYCSLLSFFGGKCA